MAKPFEAVDGSRDISHLTDRPTDYPNRNYQADGPYSNRVVDGFDTERGHIADGDDENGERAAWREEAVAEFRRMLDGISEEEWLTMRQGEADLPRTPDLFSLYGELESLRQEVKLSSRSAAKNGNRAVEQINELQSALTEQSRMLHDAVIRIQSELPKARQEAQKGVILELLRLHEAIMATWAVSRDSELSPLAKLFGAGALLKKSAKSLKMLLDKSEDILRRLNVVKTVMPGDKFDAQTMRVVSTTTATQQAAGTVVTVFSAGYKYNDEIIQIAEVEIKE